MTSQFDKFIRSQPRQLSLIPQEVVVDPVEEEIQAAIAEQATTSRDERIRNSTRRFLQKPNVQKPPSR